MKNLVLLLSFIVVLSCESKPKSFLSDNLDRKWQKVFEGNSNYVMPEAPTAIYLYPDSTFIYINALYSDVMYDSIFPYYKRGVFGSYKVNKNRVFLNPELTEYKSNFGEKIENEVKNYSDDTLIINKLYYFVKFDSTQFLLSPTAHSNSLFIKDTAINDFQNLKLFRDSVYVDKFFFISDFQPDLNYTVKDLPDTLQVYFK